MYCVRDTPMPNGNHMPGTLIGSSSSLPKNAAMIEANVTTARNRIGDSRAMRTAITTSSAIDPSLLPLVNIATLVTAPKIPAIATTTAAKSMVRHGRSFHRFQANVQQNTAGTHIHEANHE